MVVDHSRILEWIPRDGDAILTEEGFVFYVFGYLHPLDHTISYLKYIPKKLAKEFNLELLPYEWNLGGLTLVRPAKLYSPANYEHIVEVLMRNHPEYVADDTNLNKKLLVVPRRSVKALFEPSISLTRLFTKEKTGQLDRLEATVVKLIRLLFQQTKVPLNSFGVHGSISLGMHNPHSDVDISVYGANNFAKVLKHVVALSNKGAEFDILEESVFDTLRRNRFIWKSKRVVFNATRSHEEMDEKFGDFTYQATNRHLSFMCEVTDARESVFRPAIYRVSRYAPLDSRSHVEGDMIPCEVVSMIGQFRAIASKGNRMEVSGSLEKVSATKTGKLDHYRVVVGSGRPELRDESISVNSCF